jgi:double-stranded uracil-DNA glycosylase
VRIYSFPAVAARNARVLILGSMPGVASLDAQQYYAHPRNQFWTLLERIYGAPTPLPYPERLQLLRDRHLALWDVLQSCVRPGSLDAAIEHHTAEPNALMELLRATPSIRRICCNGGTAHTALRRYFGEMLTRELPQIDIQQLPSTSPAHASWSFARKFTAWRRALEPAATRAIAGRR